VIGKEVYEFNNETFRLKEMVNPDEDENIEIADVCCIGMIPCAQVKRTKNED
jgi:hypothetical protein